MMAAAKNDPSLLTHTSPGLAQGQIEKIAAIPFGSEGKTGEVFRRRGVNSKRLFWPQRHFRLKAVSDCNWMKRRAALYFLFYQLKSENGCQY